MVKIEHWQHMLEIAWNIIQALLCVRNKQTLNLNPMRWSQLSLNYSKYLSMAAIGLTKMPVFRKINVKNKNKPSSSIQPFLCTETCILGGPWIRSWRVPLKITFGGSFSPLAFTAKTTVKLCLSPPQDKIGTVRFPVNSNFLVAGNSNLIGVSSMLRMCSPHSHNAVEISAQSDGIQSPSLPCQPVDAAPRLALSLFSGCPTKQHRGRSDQCKMKLTTWLLGLMTFVHLPFSFQSLNLLCRFTLVYEGHFVLWYRENLERLDRAMANFKRS